MVRSPRNIARRSLLALALLGAWSCGKKGPPMPPLRHNPAAAQDLAIYQQGSEWVLQAAYPKTTVAGMALPGLEAIEIWSMERPVPAPPPPPAPPVPATTPPVPAAAPAPAAVAGPANPDPREFQAQARLARTLRGAELQSSVVGDRLIVRVPSPAAAVASTFAMKTVATGGDASGFSNLATVVAAAAPEPPAGLATTPRPNGVEVSWSAATPAPQAYRVYRRSAQARGYGDALHESPASESSYLDSSAVLGERYVYTVAAVASAAPLVLSPLSAESEVDYQDRFPPPPPAGLVALPEGSEVRLRWNASEGDDTAGYVVFRQDPGGEFHRVTNEPVSALEYVDSGLVAGNTYRYRVAAVDRAGNEGQPGDAVEGIVR